MSYGRLDRLGDQLLQNDDGQSFDDQLAHQPASFSRKYSSAMKGELSLHMQLSVFFNALNVFDL